MIELAKKRQKNTTTKSRLRHTTIHTGPPDPEALKPGFRGGPKPFKRALDLTEIDDLKFEIGKLHTLLQKSLEQVMLKGKKYWILADPLNGKYELMDERPG